MRISKHLLFIIVASLFSRVVMAQLTMDSLKKIVAPLRLGYSTYFSEFAGKEGYGGPYVLTNDGGGAAFGDNVVYKFDKTGKEQWKRTIKSLHDEMETQSMAQDSKGNLYAFMLTYNSKVYHGGVERVVCYDKTGKQLWDKIIGKFSSLNNPIVSYIRPQTDGKIYLRGHVAREKGSSDPVYRFWEGWMDVTGKLTEKTGDVIDWKKDEWQKKFKPD